MSGASPILRYFTYAHLRPELADISSRYSLMANWLEFTLPAGPEKTVALRKLLESKDAAVRAGLDGLIHPGPATVPAAHPDADGSMTVGPV